MPRPVQKIALCCLLLIAGLSVFQFPDNWALNSSLMDLIPEGQQASYVNAANRALSENAQNQIVMILQSSEKSELTDVARELLALIDTKTIVHNSPPSSQRAGSLYQLYNTYRFQLLARNALQAYADMPASQLVQQALRAMYSVATPFRPLPVTEDPLNLSARYFEQLPAPSRLQLQDRFYLAVEKVDEQFVALITAELDDNALAISNQPELRRFIDRANQLVATASPSVSLDFSGLAIHTLLATEQSRQDIMVIAIGSSLGIIILFLFSFKSLTPLLLSILVLAIASSIGAVWTQSMLGNMHIITLVFGASLIGVAIDYALHFFVSTATEPVPAGQLPVINRLFPALTLSMLSSALAYLCLSQAGLLILKQIAVFSSVGLASAWLCVLAILPLHRPAVKGSLPQILVTAAALPVKLWYRLPASGSVAILVLGSLIAASIVASTAVTEDSPRALHQPDPVLVANDRQVQQLFNAFAPNQYFLVTGSSAEQLLTTMEQLAPNLDEAVSQGYLGGYYLLTSLLPSLHQQMKNYQWIGDKVIGANGAAEPLFDELGIPQEKLTALRAAYLEAANRRLVPSAWQEAVGHELAMPWLGQIDTNIYGAVVPLRAPANLEALQALASRTEGVSFIDNVAAIGDTLYSLRVNAQRYLFLAYLVIAGILFLLYRRADALLIPLVPLCASALTLLVLGFAGIQITLFQVLALFLVLGLGVDYAIFYYSSAEKSHVTAIAVTLAAITSALAFGLLSLSQMPMIQQFGLTVLIAGIFNLLLAPICCTGRRVPETNNA